ncbi:MAG: DUF4837 family protein [Cyclobacteriaceae bacterium]
MNKFVLLVLLALLAASCNQKNPEYLPVATGKPGDMILIMDSVQWNGPVGNALRKIFKAEVPGLPREEPMFNLIYVHPRKGTTLLTQIRNLVFVFTLDQNTPGSQILRESFDEETLTRIQSDSSFFVSTASNEYARGQEVMYLFGNTEADLLRNLAENELSIRNFFNDIEKKRAVAALTATSTTRALTEFLKKENGIEIRVPFGFKVADKQPDFVWLRQMDAKVDKSVFITWKRYESEYQFLPDSLVSWRNQVLRNYLFEDPDNPDSFLVTETQVPFKPVIARQFVFNNAFAMELRGLWKTNTNTMGGPFISYAVADQQTGLIYYLEGFCYSPGKDQRETIRELEAILSTFRTSHLTPAQPK